MIFTNHYDILVNANSLLYRVVVVDSFQTTTIDQVNYIPEYDIYGPSANAPTNSTEVRSLGTKVLISSANPFNFIAGTTFKHTVAYHLQHYH
jgi:hypothetical protein